MSNERIRGVQDLGRMRQELQVADRGLRDALGNSDSTLNGGDVLAVQETINLTGRLAFHEQMQLFRLNNPLIEAGLQFPIQPEDLRRADPLECDVFWNTREVISFPGGKFAMPIVESTRGVDQEGKLNFGKFDSIYMTQEAYRKEGGKQVVLVGSEDKIPKGEVQGRIQMDKEILTEINEVLTGIKRIALPESLASRSEENKKTSKVVGFHIYPARDTSDKGIEFFYNRGHVALVLELENGESKVMTLNAIGDDGRQGGVNLVQFTDGRYGIVDTVRMLVGAGRKYRPEISRGYANVLVKKFTDEIKKKFGEDITADQLGMELGLKVEDALNVETRELRQDWAYENVTPVLSKLTFDKDRVMNTASSHVQQLLEEFEGLQPKKVTVSEVLDVIEKGDMVDSFSLTAFASEFLNNGSVVLNPRFAGSYVVLERKAMPQIGNEEVLVVPQGPAFEPGMTTIGQIHPNTGNARFWYQARYSTNPAVLEYGPKYEKVSIQKVLGMMSDLSFSVVDSATLFRVLLNQKVLIPTI